MEFLDGGDPLRNYYRDVLERCVGCRNLIQREKRAAFRESVLLGIPILLILSAIIFSSSLIENDPIVCTISVVCICYVIAVSFLFPSGRMALASNKEKRLHIIEERLRKLSSNQDPEYIQICLKIYGGMIEVISNSIDVTCLSCIPENEDDIEDYSDQSVETFMSEEFPER